MTYLIYNMQDDTTTPVRERNEFAAINTWIACSTDLATNYNDEKFAQVYSGLCIEQEMTTTVLDYPCELVNTMQLGVQA